MSYDCVCDYDVSFYRARIRKARKPHKCEECGSTIRPGEKYEHAFGICEGWTYSPNTCMPCRDLRQWVKNNVPCFCWAHGSMIDDAKEAIEEARHRAPQETVGLLFGFLRRKVMLDRANRERRAA